MKTAGIKSRSGAVFCILFGLLILGAGIWVLNDFNSGALPFLEKYWPALHERLDPLFDENQELVDGWFNTAYVIGMVAVPLIAALPLISAVAVFILPYNLIKVSGTDIIVKYKAVRISDVAKIYAKGLKKIVIVTKSGRRIKQKHVAKAQKTAQLLNQRLRAGARQATQIDIEHLCDNIQYTARVARWIYDECVLPRGVNQSHLQTVELMGDCYRNRLPVRLIAMFNKKCIGTAALVENDFIGKCYTPWLAGVYVDKEFRSQGIGTELVEQIGVMAKRLGIKEMYFRTETAGRYCRSLGWQFVEAANDNGLPTEVFRIKL